MSHLKVALFKQLQLVNPAILSLLLYLFSVYLFILASSGYIVSSGPKVLSHKTLPSVLSVFGIYTI